MGFGAWGEELEWVTPARGDGALRRPPGWTRSASDLAGRHALRSARAMQKHQRGGRLDDPHVIRVRAAFSLIHPAHMPAASSCADSRRYGAPTSNHTGRS